MAAREQRPAPSKAKMRQTTLRFGEGLWRTLEAEARLAGVSVAQYVREAAITRLAYDAGRRGDPEFEVARARASEVEHRVPRAKSEGTLQHAREAVQRAEGQREGALALLRQSQLARDRSRQLRAERGSRQLPGADDSRPMRRAR